MAERRRDTGRTPCASTWSARKPRERGRMTALITPLDSLSQKSLLEEGSPYHKSVSTFHLFVLPLSSPSSSFVPIDNHLFTKVYHS